MSTLNNSQGYSRDIWLVLIASFFYMASPMMVTPLIAGYSQTLGASGAMMGTVAGAMNLCSLFCRPLVGNLTDRISKFKLAAAGSLLMFVATMGYVCAPNMTVVVVARIANGLGFACCSVCMSTWMSDMLPTNRIGSGMGMYGTMNALSMALSPALSVTVSQKLGYRPAFLISAGCALLCLLISCLVGDKGEPRARANESDPKAAQAKTRLSIVEVKAIPVALIIMLFGIPYMATQSFLVSYVAAKGTGVTVSLFFPLYAVILLIVRLSFKSKFDQWPYGVFFGAGCISSIIGMVGMTFLSNNAVMFLAAAGFACGYGIMCSVSQSTAILLAGPGKRGVANSTYYIGLDLCMCLGPFLGGVLYDAVPPQWFYPCLMVCVPLSIAVFVVWRIVKK